MLHGRHWETWPRRPLELLANILGAIGNMLLALVEAFAWMFPWRRRAKAAPELPEGTIQDIVAALKADKDVAAHLPKGWRGFHAGLDEAPWSSPPFTICR
jgi:hypothetical protein